MNEIECHACALREGEIEIGEIYTFRVCRSCVNDAYDAAQNPKSSMYSIMKRIILIALEMLFIFTIVILFGAYSYDLGREAVKNNPEQFGLQVVEE